MGRLTTFTYDANGNVLSMTDANANAGAQPKISQGATLYKQYDQLNRVTVETDALNYTTQYTYDLFGDITSITDGNGNTTYFDYDDLGRLVDVRDPLNPTTGLVTAFTYDEAGNVLTYTFYYDLKNRLTQKTDGRVGKNITSLTIMPEISSPSKITTARRPCSAMIRQTS